jgi:hypothetical protein
MREKKELTRKTNCRELRRPLCCTCKYCRPKFSVVEILVWHECELDKKIAPSIGCDNYRFREAVK